MTEPRTYPEGVPCWVDCETPDVEASCAFYGELFGWSFSDAVPADAPGSYLIATLGGRDVAAIAPGDGARWSTYVAVDDADAAATRCAHAGGTIVAAAQDAGPGGRAATCTDATGAELRLWQARRRLGAQAVNEPGTWNFSDLRTADTEAALAFYATVFGWESGAIDDGGGPLLWRRPGYADHLAATIDPQIHERHAAISAPRRLPGRRRVADGDARWHAVALAPDVRRGRPRRRGRDGRAPRGDACSTRRTRSGRRSPSCATRRAPSSRSANSPRRAERGVACADARPRPAHARPRPRLGVPRRRGRAPRRRRRRARAAPRAHRRRRGSRDRPARARRRRRAGPDGVGRPALLRLRHRRLAAGRRSPPTGSRRRGTRTAFARASSPAVAVARGGRRRRGRSTLLGLPRDREHRLRHRRADGQRRRAWPRRATRCCDRAGWDTTARGLFGAPEIEVVVGDEAHATVPAALRLLGLGEQRVTRVATDANGAHGAGRARRRARRLRRPDDRLRPGGQRQHRRLRSARRDRRRRGAPAAPGCTSTAPSACGPRPPALRARWSPGASAPTPGRWTPTSG